jgi:hypothetical protein
MIERRSWPERYRVTLVLRSGARVERDVTTVFDEAKAVAMVVSHHVRGSADDTDTEPFTVSVEDLGPVPKGADGGMEIPGRDLVDRWEF